MTSFQYSISKEVFQKYPGYVRGVVIARRILNGPSSEQIIRQLRQAEDSLRGRIQLDQLTEEPRIGNWREAYRSFGAKPSEFRSSIEAMSRRVLRGDKLPSINTLVDIGNIISLRYLIPTGSHAIDHITGDIALRMATGQEDFVAFGSDQHENPLPGEVIFSEGNTVLCRRWTWRQANHSLTLPETTAVEFNIDGLPPVSVVEVEQVCGEVVDMVTRFCSSPDGSSEVRYEILSQDHPYMLLA